MKLSGSSVAVICTLLNEGVEVKRLVSSLKRQTVKPAEIIIVDGGSKDETVKFIHEVDKNVKVVVKQGVNIAAGRNAAVAMAKTEFIASIDGGCVADEKWLENLLKRQNERNADVIAGVFTYDARNLFEEVQGIIACPEIARLKDGWFPSARSMMFRKKAWEEVQGFPENLYTGEDTVFNNKLKKAGFKYALARDALVKWRMRPTIGKFWKQYYLYGVGDGRGRVFLYEPLKLGIAIATLAYFAIVIASLFYNLTLFATLVLIGFLAMLPGILKVWKKTEKIKGILWAIALINAKRFSYLIGLLLNLIRLD